MIERFARATFQQAWLSHVLEPLSARLRRYARLAEDVVPHGIHRFDRRSWVIKETAFGVRLWCSLDERAISRPILLDRYEPAETRFIERTLRPGDFAVDAGANIGYHALHLAQLVGPEGAIVAFEPLSYLADALQASVDENRFSARVAVHRLALDERPGRLPLRHAPRTANFGGAHFASEETLPQAHADETVSTVPLDEIVGNRPCRFLKLDVEGAEARVIRGAHATIAGGRPIILAELHDRQLRLVSGVDADGLIAQLEALRYRCSRLNPDGTRGAAIRRYADDAPINVVFDPQEV